MAPHSRSYTVTAPHRLFLALAAIASVGLSAPSCQNAETAPLSLATVAQDSVLLARLNRAPLSLSASGQTLVLNPFVWRDFMPISPPDGKPMIAVLRFAPADSNPLRATITVDSAWVINRSQIWAQRVTEVLPPQLRPGGHEVAIREGPKWGPGVSVDVVAQIRINGGNPLLLRAPNVIIQRTD